MGVIITDELTKNYIRFKKEEGLRGSIKSLFNREKVIKTAINSFNLNIDEGEFVGLIGPNGAGKTTLIKMLTGIISPSEGYISVLGYQPNELKDEYKRQFAVVMGQKSQLFFELTAADTFLLLKEIYGIPEKEYRKSLEYFVELFSVSEYLNVQVRTLSLGERMKMELIAALIHNPKILFLDEPTIGLDAIAQKQIRTFLKEVNRDRRTTILLTSHYMEDIKSLCCRCIVVNGGIKIYDGSLSELLNKYQTHRVISISFEEATQIDSAVFDAFKVLDIIEQNPYKVSFSIPKDKARSIITSLINDVNINDISIEEEDISNVVERIYAEKNVVKAGYDDIGVRGERRV